MSEYKIKRIISGVNLLSYYARNEEATIMVQTTLTLLNTIYMGETSGKLYYSDNVVNSQFVDQNELSPVNKRMEIDYATLNYFKQYQDVLTDKYLSSADMYDRYLYDGLLSHFHELLMILIQESDYAKIEVISKGQH